MRDTSLEYYARRLRTMQVLPGWIPRLDRIASKIRKGEEIYRHVESKTGVPWAVVAAIHSLECDGNFRRGLHCGQPWNKRTTLVPEGRGPFESWEDAAVDALEYDKLSTIGGWTPASIAQRCERYNGTGYARRDLDSPYLWSGTNHGIGLGKFVEDGRYDKNTVSMQAGVLAILAYMGELGEVENDEGGQYALEWAPGIDLAGAREYQAALLRLGYPVGKIDGRVGPKTADAHFAFCGGRVIGDPRPGKS